MYIHTYIYIYLYIYRCQGLHVWMSGLISSYNLLDVTSKDRVIHFLGLTSPADRLEDERNRFIIHKLNNCFHTRSIMSDEGSITYLNGTSRINISPNNNNSNNNNNSSNRSSCTPDDVSLQDMQSTNLEDEAVMSPTISAMAIPLEVTLAGNNNILTQ